MKKLIISLCILLITTTAQAQSDKEKQILYNIDTICGDTWCSNPDYTFTFEQLLIRNGKAKLYFTTYKIKIKIGDDGNEFEEHIKYHEDICEFPIVADENLEDLTDDTMEAIGDCLFPME